METLLHVLKPFSAETSITVTAFEYEDEDAYDLIPGCQQSTFSQAELPHTLSLRLATPPAHAQQTSSFSFFHPPHRTS